MSFAARARRSGGKPHLEVQQAPLLGQAQALPQALRRHEVDGNLDAAAQVAHLQASAQPPAQPPAAMQCCVWY